MIIGGHRDGVGPGRGGQRERNRERARSGARGGGAAKRGMRPKRTIVFATWDAEEWGLIGSTEYVEDDSLRLVRGGVAYLNQDVAAQGARFGGGGSPSLRALCATSRVWSPIPSGKGSVYEEWRRASAVADTAEPAMGDPGGGSDFAGFYNHLGIPIAEWGFGGAGGVYHSQYDSSRGWRTFGDPGFVYHATAARIGAAMVLRLANADILPYDYVEFARTMQRYLPALDHAIGAKKWRHRPRASRRRSIAWSAKRAAYVATRDSR